jgi:putative FmdB family regulatory protein
LLSSALEAPSPAVPLDLFSGENMPTYEYACTECGDRTEVVQRISDAPLTTCTVCGGPLRKVFSPVGIVFKGSGFYRTDSRGKPARADGDSSKKPADTGAKSSSDGKSGSTSTTKPAEKSA